MDLSLQQLFEHPTIAGLAEHIDTLLWVTGEYRVLDGIEEIRI